MLARASRDDDLRSVLEPDDGQFHVNANLCESILAMRPDDEESTIEYSVSWAPSLPPPSNRRCASAGPVRFSSDEFEVIERIHARLRPKPTDALSFFAASIDELRGETNDENRREGEVVLSLYPKDEDVVIKARAILNVAQYALADQAHMQNKYVFVGGRLRRGRRSARLTDISLFQIPRSDEV